MFDTGIDAKTLSFPVNIMLISGNINANSRLVGKLETINKTENLEKTWMLDVLNNGMAGNAFHLGTAMSMGWFWMRNSGCKVLYRGRNIEEMDFPNILKTAHPDEEIISPPEFCEHDKLTSYYYVVRRFNKVGNPEKTISAAVRLALDANGDIEKNRPNSVLTSAAEIIEGDKVRLSWIYCPLYQKAKPSCFKIYFDNGSGQIDNENPISEIPYIGPKLYRFKSPTLNMGTHLFAIKVADSYGVEENSLAKIKVQIEVTRPMSLDIMSAKII
jgi:hypothetical protein